MIITEAGLEVMMRVILIMIMMMIIMISDDNDGGRPSSSDKCAVQLRRGGAPTLNTLLQIICRSLDHSVSLSKSFQITMISKTTPQNHGHNQFHGHHHLNHKCPKKSAKKRNLA